MGRFLENLTVKFLVNHTEVCGVLKSGMLYLVFFFFVSLSYPPLTGVFVNHSIDVVLSIFYVVDTVSGLRDPQLFYS